MSSSSVFLSLRGRLVRGGGPRVSVTHASSAAAAISQIGLSESISEPFLCGDLLSDIRPSRPSRCSPGHEAGCLEARRPLTGFDWCVLQTHYIYFDPEQGSVISRLMDGL